jgi:hypothetical protein
MWTHSNFIGNPPKGFASWTNFCNAEHKYGVTIAATNGDMMEVKNKAGNWDFNPMPIEKDPSGKDLKEPGAKGDLGKIPVARGAVHYFPRAITAIAELSAIGARKYSWKGWESVPDGINRYGDALLRHECKLEQGFESRDPDTGILEVTAVAWNAMARLELILREKENG